MNNGKNNRKRRRWIWFGGGAVLLVALILGAAAMLRSNHEIDPSKLAKVERGDLARVVVGVVSGLVPALRASRLNPVEALRYE